MSILCVSRKKKIILLSLSCTLETFPERAELWGDFKSSQQGRFPGQFFDGKVNIIRNMNELLMGVKLLRG